MVCTIAISTYNSEAFFRRCLEQLLSQSLRQSFEVIVIDSGSDQYESAICAQYAPCFESLTCVRTSRETLYSAWNRALALAKGRYFVNANTDDALHPDALRMLAEALDSNPDAALAYGDWMWSTVPNATFPWDPNCRRCVHSEYHPSLPLFYCYTGCNQFWRTDKLRELGGFNAKYKAAGDYDALCRLSLARARAVYISQPVSAFYQNPEGISQSSSTSPVEFEKINRQVRAAITIQDIYGDHCQGQAACASAYVDLGRRAMALHIPWSEQPTPDADFAAECARKALKLDPRNKNAAKLLSQAAASLEKPSRSFSVIDRLRRKLAGYRKMVKGIRTGLFATSDPASPIQKNQDL